MRIDGRTKLAGVVGTPLAHTLSPAMHNAVYEHLGLPTNTRITTYNTDGRWYVMNCSERYDVIFTDAFNDLSIPYHLTTKEFVAQLKSIMTPDAMLMSNIIDNFQKGAFLPSYMKTLQEVFGEKNVYLLSVSNPGTAPAKQVHLVAQLPPGLQF